jgi:tetratricopeptide (TPR) repeat protein
LLKIFDGADALEELEKEECEKALHETHDMFFHIGEDDDVPFELGRCAYQMQRPGHVSAISFYRTSLRQFGEHAITFYNLALCYKEIGQRENALRHVNSSLRHDPHYEPALLATDELQRLIVRPGSIDVLDDEDEEEGVAAADDDDSGSSSGGGSSSVHGGGDGGSSSSSSDFDCEDELSAGSELLPCYAPLPTQPNAVTTSSSVNATARRVSQLAVHDSHSGTAIIPPPPPR